MEQTRVALVKQGRAQTSDLRKLAMLGVMATLGILSPSLSFGDSASANYNPPWAGELDWASHDLFAHPSGSYAYLDNNSPDSNFLPWWQTRVAHPIKDYQADLLPTGTVRLDSAVMAEVTFHRLLKGWSKQSSPTGIDNVYTFSPGSQSQEDQTARAGQNAYFNLGMHPTKSISADIGAEVLGNYDQRYWFPVNDEHRMFKDDRRAKIVRGEIKYDNGDVMLRGFQGVPRFGAWIGQNDLFALLPVQSDVEYYRRLSGNVAPRGGEARLKTRWGTLDVLGGTEPRWTYGSSVYARYDAPLMGSLEQSLVYRNENIAFGFQDPDERRWAMSYNASYTFSERLFGHAGLLYQPFRLDRAYQDVDGDNTLRRETTKRRDAFGITLRSEVRPDRWLDVAGLGYTMLGPVAGNKHQVDVDASRTLWSDWTFSTAYIYRQPIKGPVPLTYEGTAANPGAYLSFPRGPDDPFRVGWDNRKAHLLSMTVLYDPTPGTPFFKMQRNMLEEWNYNPDEDATWLAALQYRMTHYLTNLDRQYFYDEERNLSYDPIAINGARATSYPFSSATALLRWKHNQWHVTTDFSGGETLAGAGVAYTSSRTFYKPSTVFFAGGMAVDNSIVKAFFRYSQDVWLPYDYGTQFGWTYHKIYQAGLSLIFLKDAEAGFRYTGTRMTNDFIGSDVGAFNEYTLFLSYHFTLEKDFSRKFEAIGRPLPQTFPEVRVALSGASFTPDGSGPTRNIVIYPQATAEAGILSWKILVRNAQGQTVRHWDGSGALPQNKPWDGSGDEGQELPSGLYSVILNVVDLYGNEASSPPVPLEILSRTVAPVEVPRVEAPKAYSIETISEGLRVTLSSLILFDVGKEELKDSSKEGLLQVVELLKAYPTNQLRITGHTDASGSKAFNQALSERRANAVRDYLLAQGKIDASRMQVVGYGKERPVASNLTEEGRQKNRRVEIDILK